MKKHVGLLLAVCFFIIQSLLVPRTGMSWDEPASFFIGRANLKYWLTGNRQYLIDIHNKDLFKGEPIQYIFGEEVYPPFPFIVSSWISYIFAEKLQIIPVDDAHHIGEILLGSLGVGAMYGIAIETGLPIVVGVGTALIYGFYPTIFDTMRNDAKDIPLMSMLVVAMYCFIRFFKTFQTKGHPISWWGIGSAVAFGLALASKPTAAIAAPILLVWILVSALRSKQFRRSMMPVAETILTMELLVVIAVAVFIFNWPWIWDNPVGKLLAIWEFFKTVGQNMPTPMLGVIYNANVTLPRIYPLVILGVQTPVEILVLSVIGMVWATYRFFRRGDTLSFLFVIWFWVSMGRFFIPGVIIYSKVRHFIDAMPAFFILTGFGIVALGQSISMIASRISGNHPFTGKKYILAIICGLIILHEIIISILFYPYEVSYFNFLVGGAKNVATKQLFDIGYTSAVKEAMAFIARDSNGKKTMVYPCMMGHLAVLYAPPNVSLTSHPELAQYTIVPNSKSWFDGALRFGNAYHLKAYTISRQGADLFYVYKYKNPFGWRCGYETSTNYYYYEGIR